MTIKESPHSHNLIRFFHRHFVPIHFTFEKAGLGESGVLSAFVLEVSNCWMLVTAGHCLDDVETRISDGWRITNCCLIDGCGQGAQYRDSIPYEFDLSPTYRIDEDGFDFGVLPIPNNTRRLMEANGITSLDERVWRETPDNFDFFLLLGVPDRLTTCNGETVDLASVLVSVTKMTEEPKAFEKVEAPTFFGRVARADYLPHIAGMSGGPIFGFNVSEAGLKYWLHAVQSRWIQGERLIAACEIKPFAKMIEEVLQSPAEDI